LDILEQLDATDWRATSLNAADPLESGKVLYAPALHFELSETERLFLSPECLDGKSKNISFRPANRILQGTNCQGHDRQALLEMLERFYSSARSLIASLCPAYRDHLSDGFTSFRPAEISGRASSWRKDDTRLHIDAFPSRPIQGRRILRVFTNVNPRVARIWRVGEPFERVAATFLPHIRPPFPGSSWLFQKMRIVKGRRTLYDHFMLGIHDRMKADDRYQSEVSQTKLAIPPGATWTCFTDSVSHAAISGQFAFEQTFYLPVSAMQNPAASPLKVLERLAGQPLI
jgi:hypothetical protein